MPGPVINAGVCRGCRGFMKHVQLKPHDIPLEPPPGQDPMEVELPTVEIPCPRCAGTGKEPARGTLLSWAEKQIEKAAERAYTAYYSAGCLRTWAEASAQTREAWREIARATIGIDLEPYITAQLHCARYIFHPETDTYFSLEDIPGQRAVVAVRFTRKFS